MAYGSGVDGSALKVFKYTLTGNLLGSWTMDLGNTHPSGVASSPGDTNPQGIAHPPAPDTTLTAGDHLVQETPPDIIAMPFVRPVSLSAGLVEGLGQVH